MTFDRTKAERLMKRCQIGVGGRNALNDAHDIMAECYGTIGSLLIEIDRLGADSGRLQWLIDNHEDALLKKGPIGWDVWVTTYDQESVWLAGETARDAIDHAIRDAEDVRENGTPYRQQCDAEEGLT